MRSLRRRLAQWIGNPAYIYGHGVRLKDALTRGPALVKQKRNLCRLPREQLRQRQLDMLKPLLIHAGRTCPFYRRRFKTAGFDPASLQRIEDLAQVPPLTKDDIRNHIDELVSEGFDQRQFHTMATGGSTGVPVQVHIDFEAWLHTKASLVLADEYAGWRPGEPLAALWGASFDVKATKSLLGKLTKFTRNQLYLGTFRLDEQILARHHDRLARFRPAVLLGYTSSLLALADWLDQHGITPGYPTTSIINAAEMLLPWQRERMETIYGAPVFDRYGSRDVGPMAMECEVHNGLHLNSVDLLIEPHGGTPGEPQEVLITNLNAYGMPLIRYAIGDMATFSDRLCPCGRTTALFDRIVGRVTDVIFLGEGRLLPGEFFPHLLKDFPINEFQVIQEEDRSLTIRAIRGDGYGPEAEERITALVTEYTHGLPLRIEYVDAIDRTRTGKLRPVISNVTDTSRSKTADTTK